MRIIYKGQQTVQANPQAVMSNARDVGLWLISNINNYKDRD